MSPEQPDNTVTVVLRRYHLTPAQIDHLAEEYFGVVLETAGFNDPGVRLYEFRPATAEGHAPDLFKQSVDHARAFQKALDQTFKPRT